MTVTLATYLCCVGILVLFWLDKEPQERTSKALWIPVLWLWITASREVSHWLVAFGATDQVTFSNVLDPNIEGSPLDRFVFTSLLVLGLTVLAVRGRRTLSLLRINLPILLFFAYCALSVGWSDFADVAFKRWIKALGDVVMIMVVLTDSNRLTAVKRLLARAAFLLVPLSVLFIKYYPRIGRWYKSANGKPVYVGVATNKNLLGVLCLLFGLATLWRLLAIYRDRTNPRRIRHLVVHSLILLMIFWLFAMADSLTSLACFVLAGGLMAATQLRTVVRRPAIVHVLVGIVVFASFVVLFFGADPGALEAMGKDPTLTGRTQVWDLCLSLGGNPLIGTGFESFWMGKRLEKIWSVYWWHPNEAHNGYIEVFLNLGWIGILLLGTLIVTGYRNVISSLKFNPQLGRLLLAFFVVGVVYNFTEAGFRMLDPIWISFLLSIMMVPKPLAKSTVPSRLVSQKEVADATPQLDHGVVVHMRECL